MARQNGKQDRRNEERSRRPQRRLAIGGEIHHDAAAERDGEPGHQASGRGFGERPFAQALRRASEKFAKDIKPLRRDPAAGRTPRPPRCGPSA